MRLHCFFSAYAISLLIAAAPAFAEGGKALPTTAEGRLSYGIVTKGGKKVPSFSVRVHVNIRGEEARKAYAIGQVNASAIVVNGKTLTPKEPNLQVNGFTQINRDSPFGLHPSDGVGFELLYGGIAKNDKLIDAVKGTVEVLVGGTEKAVTVGNLLRRKHGPIESSVLDAAKLKVGFERRIEGDGRFWICIKMDIRNNFAFAGVQLIGNDGKPIKGMPGYQWNNDTLKCQYWVSEKELETAKLKILVREGWEKKVLPFKVRNVNVK